MNAYRFNQIAMAVLGALLLFFGARTIINIAFEEHEEKPGYDVPGTEAGKPEGEKPAGGTDLAVLLAKGNEAKGTEVAKKCGLCHNFEKGGPNMIGPNLYSVLGRKIASHEGYEYSDALKAKEGNWDYEKINHMIENPNAFVPGTKMAIFPGLPDAQERADVLLFLRTKNDNPPALPEATAGATPAPAGGGTTPGGTPAAPAAGGSDFMAALATADPKAGEADVGICKVCHAFNKGGGALIGPDLYGVVGRKIALVEGFNYTPALKAHEGDWTFEKLDAWLTNPAAFAPGTAMAFPGIPDTKKRADVIAYLNANSDSPLPLPKAGGAPAEKAAETPAAAPSAETPAAPATEAAPPAETPAAPAPEASPSAETPASPAPEAAPPAETPAAPAPEASPSAETPTAPAPEAAPPAETPAAPAPEAAPLAETPTSPATEAAPPAEAPVTPAPEEAAPEEAPSAETPAAPAPSSERPQQ
jgi:cytochrome c